jgi:bifunctional DNase/RNase
MESTEVRITSILVDQLRPISDTAPGGTYFAIMTLRKTDGTAVRIDARPSDAIALAVRSGLSIYVSRRILDENGIEDDPKPVESTEPATSPPKRFYD